MTEHMEVSLTSCGRRTASSPHLLVPWLGKKTSKRRKPTTTRAEKLEIRVCVNRTCARQGSRETLAVLSGIAPPAVAVASCGCLGRCGAGPNLAVLPRGVVVGHCGTAAHAAQLLAELVGAGFDAISSLEALALRKKGEDELEKGNAAEAEALLTQAIALKPCGGLQLMYKSRSGARLGIGDNAGALADALEAARIAPDYPQEMHTLQWKNGMLRRRHIQLLWTLIHHFVDPNHLRLVLQNYKRSSSLPILVHNF
ncbi:uncharacterized protein [Typha angustifolia]|uniref:uncharacterized protein isoform X2 n=1 Tax=Typha angustifolia TaxID=59011 RepID=UPI003C2F85E1